MKLKKGISIITALILGILLQIVESVIFSAPHQSLAPIKSQDQLKNTLVPKATLTQKGYIQFLRYVVDVPEITDYTFCIWVRSSNLTYNHPLLSYSKHEEERLIRVWITASGSNLNLEILGVPVASVPVHFIENKWYHVCQSWLSSFGAWSFYLNGKLRANGFAPKLKKVPIKAEGDIVVGQEYTDFDKGLDDGIEGDISGFNLVLASTFNTINLKGQLKQGHQPNRIFKREIKEDKIDVFNEPFFATDKRFVAAMKPKNEQQVKSHSRRQIWDESLEFFLNHKKIPPLPLELGPQPVYGPQFAPVYKPQIKPQTNKDLTFTDYLHKPLGLLLVELSNDCGYLRGAPLSGKGVLVSWTKTNVRVFGGAILKTVPPFCVKSP